MTVVPLGQEVLLDAGVDELLLLALVLAVPGRAQAARRMLPRANRVKNNISSRLLLLAMIIKPLR